MMKLRAYSLIAILSIAVRPLWGQFVLSGTVRDAHSNEPITHAEVYDPNTNQVASTDAKGKFKLVNLEAGSHAIIVMALEYQTMEQRIEIARDTEISFSMEEFQGELSEVVISQRREEIFARNRLKPVEGTAIYAGKKSEVILMSQLVGNAATNNARQIYSQVVGLNIYESIDAGLQLNVGGRGLDPNRTSNFNTRQNGYDISADVLGYPESYYTPPAEALSQIEVVRGAASLQYGTQFGGLINFKMKKPADKPIQLISRQSVGSFGLFSTFNSLSGTMGRFSYYTYLNYKKGDGFRPHSGFNSTNYFGRVGYEFTEKTSATFEFTSLYYLAQQPGGLTDTQFQVDPYYSNRTRNWFEVNWKLFALKLSHKFSYKTDLSLNIFGLNAQRNALGFRGNPTAINMNPITQPDAQDMEGRYIYNRDLIRGTFQNWGAEARFLTRYQIGGHDAVLLVGSKLYLAQNSSQQGPGTQGTDANFHFATQDFPDYPNQSDFLFPNHNLAIFGEHIFFVNDHFSITPGFRYEFISTGSDGVYRKVIFDNAGNPIQNEEFEDNRTFDRSFMLLGLGASFEPNDNLELYVNLSQNYRSVTFSDIRVVNPSFVIDPSIYDERGYTFDLGVRGKWKKAISYDLGVYGLLYDERIGIVFDDRANRVRKNIGTALVVGAEVFADWNLVKSLVLASTSYKLNWFVNAAFTDSEYLASEENNVTGKKVEFIPWINLKTGLRFGYKNLLGSIQMTHLSDQYTDVENSPVTEYSDNRNGLIGPVPAYSVWDLSLSYTFKKIKLETGINNLMDEAYFTRRATGYPGPGIIPSEPRNYYLTLQLKL